MELLKELFLFIRARKKYFLIPVILMLLLIGMLTIIGGSSAVAPFIYTLF